jgi:hypothetical protein
MVYRPSDTASARYRWIMLLTSTMIGGPQRRFLLQHLLDSAIEEFKRVGDFRDC